MATLLSLVFGSAGRAVQAGRAAARAGFLPQAWEAHPKAGTAPPERFTGRLSDLATAQEGYAAERFSWGDTATWSHPHQAVQSSNLASVAYDVPHQVLQIIFTKPGPNSGDTYNYSAVPPSVYFGLMAASSKGKYHWAHIRCEYSYADLSHKSALRGCEPSQGRVGGKQRIAGAGLPLPKPRRGLLERVFGRRG